MNIKKIVTYFLLALCGLAMVIPFAWMLTTSVKSQLEVNTNKQLEGISKIL